MRALIPSALLLTTALVTTGLVRPAFAEIGDPAGVAGAVTGSVGLTSPAKQITAPVAVASGDGIVMGDNLATGTDSRLQVMLLDESAITLGPDAELTIDEFVFDPANTDANALAASLLKGTFRLVTGGVARQNPEGTSMNLPNAVLTIRGTTVMGACAATCVVALSGSGDANTAAKKPSTVTLKSAKGEVTLKRPGFYVEIAEDGSMSEPERLTDEIEQRFAGLFPPLDAQQASLSPAGLIDASGQPTQDGNPLAENQREFEDADQLDGNDTFETTSNLPIGQEIHYRTGTFGISLSGGPDDVNLHIDYTLDLAARDFGGTASFVSDAGFTETVALTGSPFQGGAISQSGVVTDPTFPTDVYSLTYSFNPQYILISNAAYDQDGPGTIPASDGGPGVAPAAP